MKQIIIVTLIAIGGLVGLALAYTNPVPGTWLFIQNSLILVGFLRGKFTGSVSRSELQGRLSDTLYELSQQKQTNKQLAESKDALEREFIEFQKKSMQQSAKEFVHAGRGF